MPTTPGFMLTMRKLVLTMANRAERRRAAKAAGTAMTRQRTYTMTDADIARIKHEAVDDALQVLLAVPVLVAHDKLGYGPLRARRFASWMQTWVKAIHEDENTLAEIVKLAQELVGYRVEWVRGDAH